MKKVISKILALALTLCVAAPFGVMAAESTTYIEVTISEDRHDRKVTDTSSKYLTEASPLAVEVVQIINENYNKMRDVFASRAMQKIMDAGLSAFKRGDNAWETYVDKYYSDVKEQKGELKDILKDTDSTLGDLEPGVEYQISFKNTVKGDSKYGTTYTVTIIRHGGEAEPAENPFTDVNENDWFYNPVMWAVENGVTAGTSATTFGPGNACTRAQAVTFLWNANGRPEPATKENPFTDVDENDWFYTPVLWAVENKVTAGTSATTFSPDNLCTRAHIVTFLWNSQKAPVMEGTNPFVDVNAGDWYYNSVLWAAENKVTAGTTPTTFGPNDTCTRAQIVTFLYNFMGN